MAAACVSVRCFQPHDQESALELWWSGMLEFYWGMCMRKPRHRLLVALGMGAALPLALALQIERRTKGSGAAAAGLLTAGYALVAGVVYAAANPLQYLWSQSRLKSYKAKSDMADIQANWLDATAGRAFFVAVSPVGQVVGTVALRMGVAKGSLSEAAQEAEDAKAKAWGFKTLEPGEAEVLRMSVCLSHRRKGVGCQLLAVAEDHARKCGAQKVILTTATPEAIPFYLKNGYEIDKWLNPITAYFVKAL